MKYYVIEIVEGESSVAGKSIYEYDNLNSALATYHSKLGVAMKHPEIYQSDLVMVMDADGMVYRTEKFVRPALEAVTE